jgi:hypothetical protein
MMSATPLLSEEHPISSGASEQMFRALPGSIASPFDF